MEKKLQWEPEYSLSKILPLYTRWQIKNLIDVPVEKRFEENIAFIPEKINKIKTLKGVSCVEILWQDNCNVLKKLGISLTDDKENADESKECGNYLQIFFVFIKVKRLYF